MTWKAVDYRAKAKDHLAKAKGKFEAGEFGYCCLELRQCIECYAYERLQLHLASIDVKGLDTWQPPKVLTYLLNIDPYVEHSVTIRMAPEGSTDFVTLGTDVRLRKPWIQKLYNSLGHFLHTQTLRQAQAGEDRTETMKEKCVEAINALSEVLSSRIRSSGFSDAYSMTCSCSMPIRRTKEQITSGSITCAVCSETYNTELSEDGESFVATIADFALTCKCGATSIDAVSKLRDGFSVKCVGCEIEYIAQSTYTWVTAEPSSASIAGAAADSRADDINIDSDAK